VQRPAFPFDYHAVLNIVGNRRVGLSDIDFHRLRHYSASVLLHAGVSITEVSAEGGELMQRCAEPPRKLAVRRMNANALGSQSA
jgi:hypothetical protein